MTLAFTAEQRLLIVWLVFTSLALVAMVAVLVWAVRHGQFARQDRARHLPLWSDQDSSPQDAQPPHGQTDPGAAKPQEDRPQCSS